MTRRGAATLMSQDGLQLVVSTVVGADIFSKGGGLVARLRDILRLLVLVPHFSRLQKELLFSHLCASKGV